MNCFERYYPAIVDACDPPERTAFETVEELLQIAFVKRFTSWEDFSHLAIRRNMIYAVTVENKEWLIGFVDDPTTVDLPQQCRKNIWK